MLSRRLFVLAAALCSATPAAACTGDCNRDRMVSVAELITGVNVALDTAEASSCYLFDENVDGRVAINELLSGVDASLNGCDADGDIAFATIDIPSPAQPADTPGSPGVVVSGDKLLAHIGADGNLNQARYTRFRLAGVERAPDAILVLVPGFEGGANTFKILAENVLRRAHAERGLAVEVWAYDRRSNQLEDDAGLQIAEAAEDPLIALDWLYGAELSLALHPALVAGPNRRAVFYNTQSDVPFMANWTGLVFSRDIDAVVAEARLAARNANVFLGGHSAGTGFTARYAATDFNLSGSGAPDPGYARLRGLVLLEGVGGSTGGTPLTEDSLDRIIARADGGLFGAVRDNEARCVDGFTPCTIAAEAVLCAGQTPPKCTPPTTAYSVLTGILNPRILASAEPVAIQAITDPDTGEAILRQDQGAAGNNAIEKVADLATLTALGRGTALSGLGAFLDDDGLVARIASFVSTSLGGPGPVVNGLITWQDITEGPLPADLTPDNGPAPTTLPAGVWGVEQESTRFDRMLLTFYAGGSNFTDWYYPAAGQSTTSAPGLCLNGSCAAGRVGVSCSTDATCAQGINLDSTALSIGRGRPDIENLTQAADVDIPVIAFGGSNGLTTVPGAFVPYARSLGACSAPSCNGAVRLVDDGGATPAFPTFGGIAGGFEVHISEGYSHVDIVTTEDDGGNQVVAPLVAFLARNAQ
ncbi:MAG: hypothetical protein ACRERC_22410 [Candidatus Binatia bacterium]